MNNANETICPKCNATFLSELNSCPFCGEPIVKSQETESSQYITSQQDNRSHIRSQKELQKKKRKRIISGVIILLSIAIVIWLVVEQNRLDTAKKNREAYLNQLRNMETDTLEMKFNNVYVDIISITPSYEVYRKDQNSLLGDMLKTVYLNELKTIKKNILSDYDTRMADQVFKLILQMIR